MHIGRILLRFSVSSLAAGLAALTLSSCGMFHHQQKPPVKAKAHKKADTKAPPKKETTTTKPSSTSTKKDDTSPPVEKSTSTTSSDTPKKGSSKDKPAKGYPTGIAVPGKPDVLLSPYNHQQVTIDPDTMKSGTLINDPTYRKDEKKFFYVP